MSRDTCTRAVRECLVIQLCLEGGDEGRTVIFED